MDDENEALMRELDRLQKEGTIKMIGEVAIHRDAPEGSAEKTFEAKDLVFAFVDQSASFVNGFEAGMIWQRIENGEPTIDCGYLEGFPVHAENVEVIARMAQSRGYRFETKPTGYEGWVSVKMSPSASAKPRPALSLVP